MNHDQPDWLASTAAKFGYGRVTISDGYALKFEYIRADVSFCSPRMETTTSALHQMSCQSAKAMHSILEQKRTDGSSILWYFTAFAQHLCCSDFIAASHLCM